MVPALSGKTSKPVTSPPSTGSSFRLTSEPAGPANRTLHVVEVAERLPDHLERCFIRLDLCPMRGGRGRFGEAAQLVWGGRACPRPASSSGGFQLPGLESRRRRGRKERP